MKSVQKCHKEGGNGMLSSNGQWRRNNNNNNNNNYIMILLCRQKLRNNLWWPVHNIFLRSCLTVDKAVYCTIFFPILLSSWQTSLVINKVTNIIIGQVGHVTVPLVNFCFKLCKSKVGLRWHQQKFLLLICVILINSLVSTLVFTNLSLEALIFQFSMCSFFLYSFCLYDFLP